MSVVTDDPIQRLHYSYHAIAVGRVFNGCKIETVGGLLLRLVLQITGLFALRLVLTPRAYYLNSILGPRLTTHHILGNLLNFINKSFPSLREVLFEGISHRKTLDGTLCTLIF